MLSASRSQRLTLLLADLLLGEKRLQNFQKKTPDFLTAGLWLERGDGRGSSHQSRDVWGNCLCRLGHQGWETLQGTASAASAWRSSSGLSPVAPTRALGRLDRDSPPRSGRGLLGSAPAAGGLGELQTRERGRGRWQHPGEDLLGAEGTPLPARAARGRGVPVLPPPRWTPYGTKCLWVSDGQKNWNQSREDCATRGAELLVPGGFEELDFLNQTLQKPTTYFWIGLSAPPAGQGWTWLNGSRLAPDRFLPSPEDQSARCGALRGGRIGSGTCGSVLRWICQKEAPQL